MECYILWDLKILISNDDGVYSEGINALYKEIKSKFQNVVVVAPDRNQSAAKSINFKRKHILYQLPKKDW